MKFSVWDFTESWSHSLLICFASPAVTLCQAELELLFGSFMYICSMRVEYVALRNKIDVLIFYVKHFCALHLFREIQWKVEAVNCCIFKCRYGTPFSEA